jgi:hypothetical protein
MIKKLRINIFDRRPHVLNLFNQSITSIRHPIQNGCNQSRGPHPSQGLTRINPKSHSVVVY